MESASKKLNWTNIIGFVLITGLTLEVILLSIQNRELKNTLNNTTMVAQVEPLKPGEKVDSVKITALDGTMSELSYSDPSKKYLLFVLSTTCPHCEKTLPIWKSIVEKKIDNCDIFGISIHDLTETKKFIENKDVGFYLVSASSDTSFRRKYKVSGVPETILLNGNGTVEKAWIGELNEDQSKEIQNLLTKPVVLPN